MHHHDGFFDNPVNWVLISFLLFFYPAGSQDLGGTCCNAR